MEKLKTDLTVIGAGPAGLKGAIQGAKAGKTGVGVDRLCKLGGACLNQGTIPSKTLRSAILDLTGYIESSYYAILLNTTAIYRSTKTNSLFAK